jgi:flagellar assembly factor FliW
MVDMERPRASQASVTNELRLHLIECSMKDACDLVHALMVNLGSAEEALVAPADTSFGDEAWNLLRTCQQLTRLLAGAVQIARRDACLDAPQPRSLPMSELLRMTVARLSRRYTVQVRAPGATNVSDVTVYVDPQIMICALEQLSDGACSVMTTAPTIALAVTYNGANLTLSLRWSELADDAETTRRPEHQSCSGAFQSSRNYTEIVATCRAMLARQGAELDVGFDDCGNLETAIVLPANESMPNRSDELAACGTPIATALVEASNPAECKYVAGRKRSGKMIILSDRFGSIEVDAQDIITFPRGIIGFADEHEFVLVRTKNASIVGWLQSATTPYMALPVVSAHALMPKYPDVDIESYAQAAGIGQSLEELAVLIVLNAPSGIPATVNLVAPIIVNASTRTGAQLLLEGSKFTTREIFILPAQQDTSVQPDMQPATNAAE